MERGVVPIGPVRRARRGGSENLLGAWSRRAGRWFPRPKSATGWVNLGGRGADRRLPASWFWILAGVAGLAGWKIAQLQRLRREPESERDERGQTQFDEHGAHRALERLIREAMYEPDSYAHIETRCRDEGDHLLVRSTFSGTNSQGEDVTNWVEAKVGLDGKVEAIVDQGP